MPSEKQIAWLLRVFQSFMVVLLTAVVTAGGTISWGALQKLDRIAETQASQGALLARLISDDATRRARMETLYEQHYRLADRVRAVELRLDLQERYSDPER